MSLAFASRHVFAFSSIARAPHCVLIGPKCIFTDVGEASMQLSSTRMRVARHSFHPHAIRDLTENVRQSAMLQFIMGFYGFARSGKCHVSFIIRRRWHEFLRFSALIKSIWYARESFNWEVAKREKAVAKKKKKKKETCYHFQRMTATQNRILCFHSWSGFIFLFSFLLVLLRWKMNIYHQRKNNNRSNDDITLVFARTFSSSRWWK